MPTSPRRKPATTTPPSLASASFLRPALLVFAVALALRLLHVLQMRETALFTVLMGDSRGYDVWARRLAAGDWIGTEVFYQAPLYPYFLGVVYRIAGPDPLVARLVQAVLGAASCAALASGGTWLFSRRVGLVAGLVLACSPAAIFFDALIQKSALDLFFTCIAVALIGLIVKGSARSSAAWLALGATVAALSLTRENALLLAAVLLGWAALRRAWRPVALFLAGMAIVFLPVVARNAAVGGGFYLTTSQLGSNFFIGNNPAADGTYMSLKRGRGAPEFERQDATELAEQAMGRKLTPREVSSYWLDESFKFITNDTGRWLQLMARKAALLINASEMLDTESQQSHAEHSIVLRVFQPIVHFGVLVPLAIVGMVMAWPRRRELGILYVLAAVYAASVVLFFVMARYRHPLLPFLALFAGEGVTGVGEFVRHATRTRQVIAATLAVVAALTANRSMLSETLMRAITEHNLGTALQEDNRVDEAVAHYRQALAIEPSYAPAFNNLGTALMAKGDLAGAVEAFRESYRLQPSSASARTLLADATYDAGGVLLERSEFRQAENALRESLAVRPDHPDALNNLGIALASQGRVPEAMTYWQRALTLKPDFANAQQNLERAKELQRAREPER